MKSIKQQYIDLTEGRMSQANFMRNLRMTMPQYITNVTSFNDSIKILKNKGILSEVIKPSELAMGIKIEMEHTDDMAVAKKIAMDHLAENPNYYSELKSSGIDTAQGLKSTIGSGDANLNKANPRDGFSLGFFEEGEENQLNEAKDEKTKWTNTSGKSMYDQFKEIDNLNSQEVLIGLDWEMEKNPELSKKDAAKVVIKNLKKNPIYYTIADLAGKEGAEAEYMGGKSANAEARQMQPLDKNMGNVVDKKMGMQPVKDVEKAKKDSDKATAQKYKTSGIDLMSLVAKTVRGVKKMDATGEKMKKIVMKEEYDPGVEGEESPAYKAFVAQKQDEKEASEVYNGLKRGDNVKVNSEVADMLKLDPNTTYTIKSFRVYRPGSLLQSVDVNLEDMNGRNVGDVNIEYVYETAVDENKAKVPGEIFKRNALAIKNTTKIGKGEEIEQRKLTKADLIKMIREELAEITGVYGGDAMNAEDGSSYLSETDTKQIEDAIKSGKIKPEEVKASAEKAMKGNSADLAMLMAFGKP